MSDRAVRYSIEALTDADTARWDEMITPFEGAQLFHRSAWLDYLAASRGIEVRQWAIKDGENIVGYFCGGLAQKGPFRIFGSPLRGWGTNFMGPIVGPGVDQLALIQVLDDLAAHERVAMTEIETPALGDDVLAAAGFQAVRGWTYQVPLTPEVGRMWRALDSNARNRIRKATKMGLTVENTDDPSIADEFYDQYSGLVKRKGFAPPYLRDYPQLLVRYLKKADLLFTLRVRDADGRVIATGLFPHDDRTIYFWGGASRRDGRELCPNELLHWTAMCLAAERGLQRYDMCGHGRFKRKFGGELVELKRWNKYYWHSARWARKSYEIYYQAARRVGAWLPSSPPAADQPACLAPQRYELEAVPPRELARWDELSASYDSRQLFHRKVWFDYLAASRGVEPRFWTIRDRGRTVGYFCGAVIRKGPFRILGSPLKGWTTNFMGPLVNSNDFDQEAFLLGLDALARHEGFAMVEIENPILAPATMQAFGYEGVAQPTYIVELTPGAPDKMWNRIDVKSRQKVKKARKLGLVVEEFDDVSLTDEFYSQFVEVLARKNLFPPYGAETPRRLFELLKPRNMLLALQIRDAAGTSVAIGLFPHDDTTVYYWGGASRIGAWKSSPNDLLQWAAMDMAAARGLTKYNMCGYGYFKSKFGGALQQPQRWHKSYWISAALARRAYGFYFDRRLRARGWWQRVTQQDRVGPESQEA